MDGFETADIDGSGGLSLAEAQVAEPGLSASQFNTLDSDNDNALSLAELEAYLGPDSGGFFGCPEEKSTIPGLRDLASDLFLLALSLLALSALRAYRGGA